VLAREPQTRLRRVLHRAGCLTMRILGNLAFAIGIAFSVIAAGFLFGPGGVFAAAAIWLLLLGLVLLT